MEMFGFRIIHGDGVDMFDTSRCTPYSSLTPAQMQEYIEADVQLNYMKIQKRKEQREISEGFVNIKQFIRKLFGHFKYSMKVYVIFVTKYRKKLLCQTNELMM